MSQHRWRFGYAQGTQPPTVVFFTAAGVLLRRTFDSTGAEAIGDVKRQVEQGILWPAIDSERSTD